MKLGASLHRDSRRFVRGLGLPPADSIRDLLPAIEERPGHPIRLMPAPAGTDRSLCGMWIRTADVDYVFVHPETSRFHQDHIIAHELGHVLRNHRGGPASGPVSPVTERLVPTLDPAVVRMMLGRGDYEHRDEQEAELIGSYLQQHVHRRPVHRTTGRVAQTLLRLGR
ncbi:hypothetical protein [Streptomyces macrosporus]|uniref:IrrE N-terminal-like domain-containing protein n=1 Tax=Streptomyces macrosporus TaxID=44032 RepID=A0ABN3KCD3_9ACTN